MNNLYAQDTNHNHNNQQSIQQMIRRLMCWFMIFLGLIQLATGSG